MPSRSSLARMSSATLLLKPAESRTSYWRSSTYPILKLVVAKHFDVILLDLGLPDSRGLDTLRTLRGRNPYVAIVVLTGKEDEELALEALKQGAQDYLVKNELRGRELHRAIRYAVERSNFEKMLRQSEERLKEITEQIDQVLWVIDAKQQGVLYVSPGYEAMWGGSRPLYLTNASLL